MSEMTAQGSVLETLIPKKHKHKDSGLIRLVLIEERCLG